MQYEERLMMKNLKTKEFIPEYSIVIPVYNSCSIISITVEKIQEVLNTNHINAEIILINDGSTDESWRIVREIAIKEANVVAIDLIKNYGQHNAIMCGFEHAQGEYVITMDDDLQNPPSEIIKLIEKITSDDYDLVFGLFREKKHSFYRKVGSKFVGYLNMKIFGKPKHLKITNFRIIKRDLIERILNFNTPYPYIPGLLIKLAGRMANIEVVHSERYSGKSNYNLRKIINLIARILINYSSFPLRILSSIGLVVSLISCMTAGFYLVNGLLQGSSVPGWTTLVVLISFLGGFIIALLALIGEYLSRILNQLSDDRKFYVKEVIK